MVDKNDGSNDKLTPVRELLNLAKGREYYITIAISVFFFVLAARVELDILGAKALPSDDKFSSYLCLAIATLFLLWSWHLIRRTNQSSKIKKQLSSSEQIIHGVQEVSQAKNISEPEKRNLIEVQEVLSDIQKNKYIELGLAEWLRRSNEDEDWVFDVSRKTKREFGMDFRDQEHEQDFQSDIKTFLECISESLVSGRKPRCPNNRAIEEKYPYKWALEKLKTLILETYDNSKTILERERKRGRAFLIQTIDCLIEDLEKSS